MTNFNLKERLHATPLAPIRYLILLSIVVDWFLTMGIGFSMVMTRNIQFQGDVFILYSSLSFIVLSSLIGLDYRNRERWIQDRILIEVPFEPTHPTWMDRFKNLDRLIWLRPILASYLPFVAIWFLLVFYMPKHDPMIDLIMVILVIPATLFYKTKKRIFDQRFTIQLADIGMIYNDQLVLWSDSFTSSWIDTLTVNEKEFENGVLEIEMARRSANEKPKNYRIKLPAMTSSERQVLLDKIMEGNAMNKAKNRNGRRFF
jgi:hypothetical protein